MRRSNRHSATVGAAVVVGVLVAIGVVVWWVSGSSTTERSTSDVARAEGRASAAADVELAAADVEAKVEEQGLAVRRAIEGAGEDVAPVAEATPTSARDSRVLVRVTVADNPWLESAWKGRLAWRDALGGDDAVDVVYGYLKLPREPRSSDQFSDLDFTGLAARPLGLTRLDEVDDPDDLEIAAAFELATELMPGARLVWAPNVPSGERTAVRVVLGTPQPPSRVKSEYADDNRGLVDEAIEVELPLALPHVVAPTALWVGAPGKQWRSFVVAPDDTRVEVRLAPAAAIRVLHDGPPGELVVHAYDNGMQALVPIESTLPIDVVDLLAGEHRVWIRPAIANDGSVHPAIAAESRKTELSRIARVTLVAGETIYVDVRAESVLDGRGGVRVFVPSTSVALPWFLRSSDPAVWRDATATTKRLYYPAPKLVSESDEGRTYELLGLTPGRHTVFVEAFAACASFDVAPGLVTDVAVELDCIGYVVFRWPPVKQEGAPPPGPSSTPCDVVADDGQLLPWRVSAMKSPMVCGTYTVRTFTPGSDSDVGLTSTSFVVNPDSTTVVTVRAEPVHHVVVTAVDASTNAPIAFDAAFWLAIDARDIATDAEFVERTCLLGPRGAYTAVEWTLHPHADPVRFIVPEHPLWTFEPLEPRVLEDGATFTLRATAK